MQRISAVAWQIERHIGESDYRFAMRRLKVAAAITAVALTIFALFWSLFPFKSDLGLFVLLLGFAVTALAAIIAFVQAILLMHLAMAAMWYRTELRHEGMKALRFRADRVGSLFSLVFLFCFSSYALFDFFDTGKITFYGKSTTLLFSWQEQPLIFIVVIIFWLAVWTGSAAWLDYKLRSPKHGDENNCD